MSTKTIRKFREKFANTRTIKEIEKIENIVKYINSFNYPEKVKNDVLFDVLSMLNDGFENGQNFDEIIGDNHKEFVDEIYRNLNKRPYFINPKIFYLIIVLPLVDVIMLFYEQGVVLDERVSFFKLVTFIILGIGTYSYEYLSKHSIYNEKKRFTILIIYLVFFFIVAVFMRYVERKAGFKISAIYYLIFSISAFVLNFTLNKYQNSRRYYEITKK